MRGNNIADVNAAQLTHRSSFGTAHSGAETDKQRHVGDPPHRDVADGDIFQQPSVNGFQSYAAAIFNHAVRNGDIPESAIAFSAKLDAAIARSFIGADAFEGRVEQRAFFVASGYVTIRDGDVIGGSRETQSV